MMLVAFFFGVFFQAFSEGTYAEVGRSSSLLTIVDMEAGMSILFDPELQPIDAKEYRKVILTHRNNLDVFMYAFPNQSFCAGNSKWTDVWDKQRKRVSDLYQSVGAFKDLADGGVPFTEKQRKALLQDALDDAIEYQDDNEECDFAAFIGAVPAFPGPYTHDAADISEHYWGKVPFHPNVLGPMDIELKRLTNGIIMNLLNGIRDLYDFHKKLYDYPEEEEVMHDYRKTLRSLRYLSDQFIPFPSVSCDYSPSGPPPSEQMDTVYDLFGGLNDIFIAYHRYVEDEDEKGIEETEEEIEEAWAGLRDYLKKNEWDFQLLCLSALTSGL